MILLAASIAACALAISGCGYLALAAMLAGRFARQRAAALPTPLPSVTILKPLCGDDPGLFDNLATFCVQDYAAPVQIICGVRDPNDAAIPAVARLREAYPRSDIDLVVDATTHGTNLKVANLINMAVRVRH